MSIYRNEQHATACAVGIDRLTTCGHSAWQDQHSSGFVEQLTSRPEAVDRLSLIERLTQDAMTRSMIKRKISHQSFLVLVAKYGADERERAKAINELADTLDSPAPAKFRRICVWAWSCVAFRRGIRSKLMESGDKHRATLYRWRKSIGKQLDELEEAANRIVGPELQERGLVG